MPLRKDLPLVILELANSHGGDLDILRQTISKFSTLKYPNLGIKFQPFSADTIAMPDYEWFDTYKKLEKTIAEWHDILLKAGEKFSIWLDIFDSFGVQVLQQNQSLVRGIKLQSSIINNKEVEAAIKCLDNSELEIIINVSGYPIEEVHHIVDRVNSLNFKDIVLQVGFQSYPTQLSDTSLNKIRALKLEFPMCRISMADHLDAESNICIDLPIWAYILGSEILEKHICLDRGSAEFDFYSALEFEQTKILLEKIEALFEAVGHSFITEAEADYLRKTEQLPLAKNNLISGTLINDSDLMYRRTDQIGLTRQAIFDLQERHFVLGKHINQGKSILEKDFRPAKIATIVACRMKSSRLKRKALLDICGESAIQRCLNSCNQLPFSQKTILATSTLEEDVVLKAEAKKCNAEFWPGDANDVIKRYLGVCDYFELDVIYRVTGDCPLISEEIAALLLDSHFASGADFTSAENAPVGAAVEIYNVEALRTVVKIMGGAKHSEYMTWYLKNNGHIFKLNSVQLPTELSQEVRLTLDYEEDLRLFREIFERLKKEKLAPNLKNVFQLIDKHPWIKEINKDCELVYKTNAELIEMLNKETKIKFT